jgi:N-acetylglucosamine-6-phosphate deacetylase
MFLSIIDVTHNKEILGLILEGPEIAKQFCGNLFKDAMSTVYIYRPIRCTVVT